jgi:hypothetical protein
MKKPLSRNEQTAHREMKKQLKPVHLVAGSVRRRRAGLCAAVAGRA